MQVFLPYMDLREQRLSTQAMSSSLHLQCSQIVALKAITMRIELHDFTVIFPIFPKI